MIANRDVNGEISSAKVIAKDSSRLAPAALVVITGNVKWLGLNYPAIDSARCIQLTSLPSYPDDKGVVVLLRKSDSMIVDELHYDRDWHFELVVEDEGVALERIDTEFQTQDKNNWTSASSSAGYGTPSLPNSQQTEVINVNETDKSVMVLPKVISPDNNGVDDFATIRIRVKEPGNVANAVIYSASGRRVKYLVKNAILGLNNMFVWDGYDDNRQRVPSGIYILFTQVFDMYGNNSRFKNCIVLDSRYR
jgi:hypothetical protein